MLPMFDLNGVIALDMSASVIYGHTSCHGRRALHWLGVVAN